MKNIYLILFALCIFGKVNAQKFDQLPDLDGNLDEWYRALSVDIETPIMNGVYFFENETRQISVDEHPFYRKIWDLNGSVTFEGRHFERLNIAYNTKKDFLLIWDWEMDKAGDKSLLINQSKIDSFSIHYQKFVRSDYTGLDGEGFYTEIMKGQKITCYSKKKKIPLTDDQELYFKEKNKYFIIYQNVIHEYTWKSSLLKIFPDQKKLIRKYFRENISILEKGNDFHLKVILEYCDSIVK